MIVIETIIVYLILINLNTSYAFSAENLINQQLTECRSHMRIIKDYVDNDVESRHFKTFYLKSAHHDNQIITGKLNSILTNGPKLLQMVKKLIHLFSLDANFFNLSSMFWCDCSKRQRQWMSTRKYQAIPKS